MDEAIVLTSLCISLICILCSRLNVLLKIFDIQLNLTNLFYNKSIEY